MTSSEWFIESPVAHRVMTEGGKELASAPKLATALELAMEFSKHKGCPVYILPPRSGVIEVDYWLPLRLHEVTKAA